MHRVDRIPLLVLLAVSAGCSDSTSVEPQERSEVNIQVVSTGDLHTCAVAEGGDAYCWGSNIRGQLGDGTNAGKLVPTLVAGLTRFASISAGIFHTCALDTSGKAYCWGHNGSGQLGIGSTESSLVPVPVAGGITFTSIHAGWRHSCGLALTGEILCWGTIIQGELELPPEPVEFTPGRRYMQLGSAGSFVCGLAEDGDLVCWGSIFVSDAPFGVAPVPLTVASGLSGHSIAVGAADVCALSSNGVTRCWLGDDTFPEVGMFGPFDIGPSPSFVSLATGTSPLCGVTNGDRVYCWSTTLLWSIDGNGSTETPMADPVEVPVSGGVSVSRSSLFHGFACVRVRLTASATGVSCWGSNIRGQLGDGTTTQRDEPTEVIFP